MVIKSKFYKNLYQSVSFFSVIMLLVFFLILGFIESLYYESARGWILLMIAVSLIILFFLVGFYWIFQKVEFDHTGIKITLFHKEIRKINWEEIEEISYTSVMKNPAFVIKTKGSKKLNLDSRKKIKYAIMYFGNENTRDQMKEIT